MNEKQSVMFASVCVVSLVLYAAYKRGSAYTGNVNDVYESDQGDATLNPDYSAGNNATTPGFVNQPWYMNGASSAIPTTASDGSDGGDLNITINPWSTLSQQYMPLFGFVGVSTGAYQ